LMAEVKTDPSAALEAILTSFATPMTVPEIKSALEGLVSEAEWQPWWTKAKKHPRVLASGSGTKVQYRLGGEGGVEDEIRAEFAAAGPAERIELARRHGARNKVLAAFMIDELLTLANRDGLPPGTVWESIHQASRLGGGDEEVTAARRKLFVHNQPIAVLEDLNDSILRETVFTFLSSESADLYRDTAQTWIEKETHPRLLSQITAKLSQVNEQAKVTTFLDQVFLHPNRYPAALTWATEITEDDPIFPFVDERRSGAFLIRLVELGERKEFSPYRTRLREVLSPRGLAMRIVQEKLTLDQAKRLLQLAELQGELATERTWLRRVAIGRFPELRQVAPSLTVPALLNTVARMQGELKNLLEKEIPEVLKAIQIAKEHGDLSENFEYHAARARQEYLSARASKLQEDLSNVRIIDPATVDLSVVRVGARVTLSSESGGETRVLTILGPYEGNPDAGIVSNGSEIAQALLERPTGTTINFDNRRWVISAIEPYTP
jgi:transcription elongation GreA/GreB family factor